jgi:hypothetical protein
VWQLSLAEYPRINCQAGPLCRQLLHNGPVFYAHPALRLACSGESQADRPK